MSGQRLFERSRRCAVAVALASVLLATGCGSSGKKEASGTTTTNGKTSSQPPVPPPPSPPPPPPPPPQPPPPQPPPPQPPVGPPSPSTPLLIGQGKCGAVADDMTAIINGSTEPQLDAHAYLALAKLCLGEDASADLEVARANLDQLSPEARDPIEAVMDAGLPRGLELRRIVRENSSP